MINFHVDHRLFQSEMLYFQIPVDDPGASLLHQDMKLEYDVGEFFITRIEDEITEEGFPVKTVEAEASWMRLADRKKIGTFELSHTPEEGLALILANTSWSSGWTSTDPGIYTLAETDKTVLELIWIWARITGNEVWFDTYGHRVDFQPQVGADLGLSFRYAKNIQSIIRTETPPEFTRVYAVGKSDLTIGSHTTGGEPYIEDYSYYTGQGLTEEEARAGYQKDDLIVDESFVDSAALYAFAQSRLAIVSQPTVTYSTKVIDLSTLVGYDEGGFKPGDTVWVEAEPIALSERARVSRRDTYPYEPERDVLELSFSPILVPDVRSSTERSDPTKNWEMFRSRNDIAERRVRQGSTILHRIGLRTVPEAEWIITYNIEGIGVGSGTLTIQAIDDETDEVMWPEQTFPISDGEAFHWSFSLAEKSVTPGDYVLAIRAFSDGALVGLDIPIQQTAFWILARGTTRQNFTLPNSIRYDYDGSSDVGDDTYQLFTVPDDVTEILIEAHGGGSSSGGLGGMVKANFAVFGGQQFAVWAPGRGESPQGGFPNGGRGHTANNNGRGGGGSASVSPIGTFVDTFLDSLLVAPGGGGAGSSDISTNDPGHGTFYGGTPSDAEAHPGSGATQDAPGVGIGSGPAGDTPSQGFGGPGPSWGAAAFSEGGGGAGGWHGGGAGGHNSLSRGGGGGSGWLSDAGWDLEIIDAENAGDGYIIISWETPEGE